MSEETMNSFEEFIRYLEQKRGFERSHTLNGIGQSEKFTSSYSFLELKEAYRAGMLLAAEIAHNAGDEIKEEADSFK